MVNWENEREKMVRRQLQQRGVQDTAVLAAMRAVPRELFVPPDYVASAYMDGPLPIGAGQTISQPYVVAHMIQLLQLTATDRVLEVGTGSGYAAAVLSQIVAIVYSAERHEELVHMAQHNLARARIRNVLVGYRDGTLGWPEYAPFEAIIVAAAGPQVPNSLQKQLTIGGRLVMPLSPTPERQFLVRVTRLAEHQWQHEQLSSVRFVPLIGQEGWEEKP